MNGEAATRSRSGCRRATWSLQEIRLPREDRRSSIRCTTTSSGRELRICCSSVSRDEMPNKQNTCRGNRNQQTILITYASKGSITPYQQSHAQQSDTLLSMCELQECGRPARFQTHHKSFQILLCTPNSICLSTWKIHQHRYYLRIEHLSKRRTNHYVRIAIF